MSLLSAGSTARQAMDALGARSPGSIDLHSRPARLVKPLLSDLGGAMRSPGRPGALLSSSPPNITIARDESESGTLRMDRRILNATRDGGEGRLRRFLTNFKSRDPSGSTYLPTGLGHPARVYLQDLGGPTVILVWQDPARPGRAWLALFLIGRGALVEKFAPGSSPPRRCAGSRPCGPKGPSSCRPAPVAGRCNAWWRETCSSGPKERSPIDWRPIRGWKKRCGSRSPSRRRKSGPPSPHELE